MSNQDKEWIQAEPDFILKYEEWKREQASFGGEDAGKKASVYSGNAPTPATNIMKNQMKSSTRYMQNLEKGNLELQTQLDQVVAQLEESQLASIQLQNQNSTKQDSLQKQLSHLASDYKRAEVEHQRNIASLSETVEDLTRKLLASEAYALELSNKLLETRPGTSLSSAVAIKEMISSATNTGGNSPTPSFDASDDASLNTASEGLGNSIGSLGGDVIQAETTLVVSEAASTQELVAKIQLLETQNAQLAQLNSECAQKTQTQDKELEQVWQRVFELHEQLKGAKDVEKDFKRQSVAIEELRDRLDGPRPLDQNGLNELKAVLPPTESRLVKTEEGWEWTPWVKDLTKSVWDQDFEAVKQELEDLKVHRYQAFKRAQNRSKETAFQIASYIPFATLPLTVLLGPPASVTKAEQQSVAKT
ncbi:hypothetical protein HDV03_004096 [Kappamyces sp. JEL0829]|nr:hypothetical protein HDV03_004096 [Kappamyces sp. JEL0829]